MQHRIRKLTTVGLPVRDELLIRSLLQVITAKTAEEWLFHEGFDADVALCNPASALANAALKRAMDSDQLICVSVLHDGDNSLPGTIALKAPIKSGDFIALLNQISSASAQVGAAKPAASASAATQPLRPTSIAAAVRELRQRHSHHAYCIESGGLAIFLIPSTRALLLSRALHDDEVPRLATDRSFRVSRLDEERAQKIAAEHPRAENTDWLQWRLGLEGVRDALLPELPAAGNFALRRWPDFGRLQHAPFHFRMAALLTRATYSLEELARVADHPIEDARAFLNACAMCDLLEVRSVRVAAPALPSTLLTAPKIGLYANIFRSIRSALGIRT